jgi:succinate-acetate transporter protein
VGVQEGQHLWRDTIPKAQVPTALGLFLLGWTIFTGIMLLASLRTNGRRPAVDL